MKKVKLSDEVLENGLLAHPIVLVKNVDNHNLYFCCFSADNSPLFLEDFEPCVFYRSVSHVFDTLIKIPDNEKVHLFQPDIMSFFERT